MRKALVSALLALALTGGMVGPTSALPTTDGPNEGQPTATAASPSTLTQSALTPAAAAALRPRLTLGSRGPAVVHVQQQLGVTPTSGYYGPLTRTAVKKLQKANGLKRTGRVTKSTWQVLLAAPSTDDPPTTEAPDPEPSAQPAPPPAPVPLTPEEAAAARPTLRQGMGPGDPAVVFVQRFLRVTPDSGYFGTLTRAAVTAYQEALGISATGTVGPLTWAAIAEGRTAAATGTPPAPAPATSTAPAPSPSPFTPPAGATPREVAVAFALAQVGKPYVLGGNGPEVFDCSGLIQQAYLAAGVKLPRLASQQRFAGTKVDLEQLLPGDLLYYQDGSSPRTGHISMYAGEGRAVEAANPRRGVRVRDLNETWYRDRFVAAIRIG